MQLTTEFICLNIGHTFSDIITVGYGRIQSMQLNTVEP